MRLIQTSVMLTLAATMAFGQPGNQATIGATNDPKNNVSLPKSADIDLRTGESRLGVESSAFRATDTKAGQFVEQAAQSGHAEIGAAHLALTKSAQAKVKSYAEMLLEDHTKSNKELMSLATKNHLTLTDYSADTLLRREQTGAQGVTRGGDLSHPQPDGGASRLAAASGSAFDRLYMEREIETHKSSIDLFEKEARNGTNADLRQFAERILPTLRSHLAQAEALKAEI